MEEKGIELVTALTLQAIFCPSDTKAHFSFYLMHLTPSFVCLSSAFPALLTLMAQKATCCTGFDVSK